MYLQSAKKCHVRTFRGTQDTNTIKESSAFPNPFSACKQAPFPLISTDFHEHWATSIALKATETAMSPGEEGFGSRGRGRPRGRGLGMAGSEPVILDRRKRQRTHSVASKAAISIFKGVRWDAEVGRWQATVEAGDGQVPLASPEHQNRQFPLLLHAPG